MKNLWLWLIIAVPVAALFGAIYLPILPDETRRGLWEYLTALHRK